MRAAAADGRLVRPMTVRGAARAAGRSAALGHVVEGRAHDRGRARRRCARHGPREKLSEASPRELNELKSQQSRCAVM